MPISEATLTGWCNQGAIKSSADTYESIKNALSSHTWPKSMNYDAYLQGSYANSTNIRGDSDVDVVVESSAVFYNNLTTDEKQYLKLGKGAYGYTEFREQVAKALQNHYSVATVDNSGEKCIKVAGSSGRLPADVVPCITYKKYESLMVVAEGIKLITKSGQTIVNYPKIHKENGIIKNGTSKKAFKPSVRMFKNARNHIAVGVAGQNAPSYFLECLIYNMPDALLLGTRREIFVNSLNFIVKFASAGGLQNVLTQSKQEKLFGPESTQWNLVEAIDFVDGCLDLWNSS